MNKLYTRLNWPFLILIPFSRKINAISALNSISKEWQGLVHLSWPIYKILYAEKLT